MSSCILILNFRCKCSILANTYIISHWHRFAGFVVCWDITTISLKPEFVHHVKTGQTFLLWSYHTHASSWFRSKLSFLSVFLSVLARIHIFSLERLCPCIILHCKFPNLFTKKKKKRVIPFSFHIYCCMDFL